MTSAHVTSLSSCLPDLVVACIQAATHSGKDLSWTLKENAHGTMVQLVWKHRQCQYQDSTGHKLVSINKNSVPRKRKKYSPSRQRRSQERLLRFISCKQQESHKQESSESVSDRKTVTAAVVSGCPDTLISTVAPETLLRKDQSVDVTPVSQLTVQPPCTASITDDQPDVEILPGVEDQVNDSIAMQQVDLGSITKPPDKPGCFIRSEGRDGQTINWHSSYHDVLIPVLHHGAIASGVDKCDLCRFHLEGSCRRGQRCTYAHSWSERSEWICPVCSKHDKQVPMLRFRL